MPSIQIQTSADIESAWRRAERESDKRAVWRILARGGWFHSCREAVRMNDRATLETWLGADVSPTQDILQFTGVENAQIVKGVVNLLSSHAVCQSCGMDTSPAAGTKPIRPVTRRGPEAVEPWAFVFSSGVAAPGDMTGSSQRTRFALCGPAR